MMHASMFLITSSNAHFGHVINSCDGQNITFTSTEWAPTHQHITCSIFLKNCMKMKTFWVATSLCSWSFHPRLPMNYHHQNQLKVPKLYNELFHLGVKNASLTPNMKQTIEQD